MATEASFKTFVVIEFSTKCAYDIVKWVENRFRSPLKAKGAELLTHITANSKGKKVFLNLSATNERFLKGAEELGLKKPYNNGKLREFTVNDYDNFIKPEKEEDFLTQFEKLKILDNAISSLTIDESQQFDDDALDINSYDILINQMFRNKLVVQVFPVHDSSKLNDVEREWFQWNGSSPNMAEADMFIVHGSVNHVKSSVKHLFKDPTSVLSTTNSPPAQVQLNINSNNNVSFKTNISHSKSAQKSATNLNPSPPPSTAVVPVNSAASKKPNEKINYTYLARNYEEEEHQKIIIYTTTLQIVRLSFDKCKRVKKILQNHCVRYEERDLYKNKEFQKELKYRLNINIVDVPHIFFSGKHIGNCDQLELYSDQGLLHKLFKDLEKIKLRIYCCKCGGYRFVLCTLCNGSKKIFNNFTNLKCTTCNEDGLIRCDSCLDQQE